MDENELNERKSGCNNVNEVFVRNPYSFHNQFVNEDSKVLTTL